MIKYTFKFGKLPILVSAIHNGHEIRPELLPYFNLTEPEREREEDPHTADLIPISDNTIQVSTSRFETDLNRPREKAVYQKPEDAWGLPLYNENTQLPQEIIETSLQNFDDFYSKLHQHISKLLEEHKYLIIYDLHSYNHRREGIDSFADPETNPEINIGTGNIDQQIWRPVLDTLLHELQTFNYEGRFLDVRENVKFKGGYFSKFLFENFGNRVCPIAIEFKKIFMNEWTGEANENHLMHLRQMLIDTMLPVQEELKKIG